MIVQAALEDLVYPPGEVVFLAIYDPQQQVYGVPDYIHGMESAMLNVDATRFRRKYYKNGAHLGYILYSTDPNMTPELEEEFRKEIENSKGAGNFKSMFINIAGGDKEGVKVIPIGDSGTGQDEFLNINFIQCPGSASLRTVFHPDLPASFSQIRPGLVTQRNPAEA
ncbi:hypothetical protein O5698_23240 [Escherichia coli]|nr:hypothetical protein [Escherichia coli]